MLSFEELMTSLQDCVITEHQAAENVIQTLRLFCEKLSESSRLVTNSSMFGNYLCPAYTIISMCRFKKNK